MLLVVAPRMLLPGLASSQYWNLAGRCILFRCIVLAQSLLWGNTVERRACHFEYKSTPSRRMRTGSTLNTCTQPAARSKSSRYYSWARCWHLELLPSSFLWHQVRKSTCLFSKTMKAQVKLALLNYYWDAWEGNLNRDGHGRRGPWKRDRVDKYILMAADSSVEQYSEHDTAVPRQHSEPHSPASLQRDPPSVIFCISSQFPFVLLYAHVHR